MSNFVDNLRWALLCTAYFPILSVLIFVGLAVLSLPYVLFSTAWLICLSLLLIAFILPDILGIFGLLIIWSGQGFLALILVPLIVLTFCAIYTVSYVIFIFTFPFWLLLGLIDSELVMPEGFSGNRWAVLFTYLIMPILSIAAILGRDIQSVIGGLGQV